MLIKNKALRDSLSKCITLGFSGLNRILPKKETQILFYTNTGIKDNLKAVMDFVANDADFTSYTLLCSCDRTDGIPQNIKPISNIKGLFAFLQSGYVFYYNGKIPIKPSKKQTVVNLWHGIPLKKIGNMLDPNADLDFSTHYLAPSPYTGELMAKAFGCDAAKLLYNGLPRCDLLFDAPTGKQACNILGFPDCTRLIGWMPTFRNAAVSEITDSDLKNRSATGLPLLHDNDALLACNEILRAHHILLWIKLHPSETGCPQNRTFSNILIQSDKEFLSLQTDYYRLLGSCDALITDYSSVYFDYLLLDRPLGFAIEDIDSYRENRGFTAADPIAQMPGEILQSKEQLFAFLKSLFCHGEDRYKMQRNAVRERYCGDIDPHAVLSLLQKINLKGD